MKKINIIFLCVCLLMIFCVGCGNQTIQNPSVNEEKAETYDSETEEIQRESIDTKNTLIADIDGEEHVFYLSNAELKHCVGGDRTSIDFEEYDSNGNLLSLFYITLPGSCEKGTYDVCRSSSINDVLIEYAPRDACYTAPYDFNSNGKDNQTVGQIIIDDMNSDGLTFSGSLSAELKATTEKKYIHIEDGEFNVTLGDYHSIFKS